jgi:purine-nucleoside phosphorylase
MSDLYASLQTSADFLRGTGAPAPELVVILGSGLDGLSARLEDALSLPFAEVPGFAASTVDFHAGTLHFGRLAGRQLALLAGRLHYYEGHSMAQVVHPLRALRLLGAQGLIVTSAVGGLAPGLARSAIVAVSDHINLMGDNPLIGPNDERLGPRFPDLSAPYTPAWRRQAAAAAAGLGIPLTEGVLAAVAGPNLETAAEYRFLRRIGADLVGMSMVPETLAAVHMGMRVLGLAVVTDLCDPEALEPVDVPAILAAAGAARPRLEALVIACLETLNPSQGTQA